MYCDAEFADLAISCKDQTFHLHKVVVCTQSRTLREHAQDTKNVRGHRSHSITNDDIVQFADGVLVMRVSRADLVLAAIQYMYLKVYEMPTASTDAIVWSTSMRPDKIPCLSF
jgi:BTB/POZ domain